MRIKEWGAAMSCREQPQEVITQTNQRHRLSTRRRQGGLVVFVRRGDGSERRCELSGRLGQVVAALVRADARGVTPLDFATGVRLAALVHRLRREHGLRIESTPERHRTELGSPGTHARYRLLDSLRLEAP